MTVEPPRVVSDIYVNSVEALLSQPPAGADIMLEFPEGVDGLKKPKCDGVLPRDQ